MKINDLTPKQFARREIIKYLRDLFDNPAKYITNFESYTHKQQEEILRFISLDEDRINKLLNLPMGESWNTLNTHQAKLTNGSIIRRPYLNLIF